MATKSIKLFSLFLDTLSNYSFTIYSTKVIQTVLKLCVEKDNLDVIE